ncbi:MAG: 4a-hydroxytetrahydrobiopterin dehydratase [Halobacteriota archaeon]
MSDETYSDSEVERHVEELEGWSYDGERIRRSYDFDSYLAGVDFVVEVADLAEKANHHPDVHVGYKEVEVSLKSHDVDGITDRDFDLAEEIEALPR